MRRALHPPPDIRVTRPVSGSSARRTMSGRAFCSCRQGMCVRACGRPRPGRSSFPRLFGIGGHLFPVFRFRFVAGRHFGSGFVPGGPFLRFGFRVPGHYFGYWFIPAALSSGSSLSALCSGRNQAAYGLRRASPRWSRPERRVTSSSSRRGASTNSSMEPIPAS